MLCPVCHSQGKVPISYNCRQCWGKGQISHSVDQGFEQSPKTYWSPCGACGGTGQQVRTEECKTCAGTGQVKEQIQSVGCPACGQVGVVAQEIGKYPSGKIKYQQVTCPECKGAKQVRRKVLVPDFS